MKKKNDQQLPEQQINEDVLRSIQEMARQADIEASKSIAQEFPFDKELTEDDQQVIGLIKDTQNPEVSYKLYYAIQGLLIQFLPKGAKFKNLRDYIFELKNVLLTQGKNKNDRGIRGGDSRQAYITVELKVMYDLITEWVKNGAMAAYLIEQLQKLNEERGYDYPGNPKKRES